jgi:hypothetical protein
MIGAIRKAIGPWSKNQENSAPNATPTPIPTSDESVQIQPATGRAIREIKPTPPERASALGPLQSLSVAGTIRVIRRNPHGDIDGVILEDGTRTGTVMPNTAQNSMPNNSQSDIMGKPIVHAVEEILGLFFTTGLDAIAIEDYLIEK